MDYSDFVVGQEFYTGSGKWRCTDKGQRVVVAIQIDPHDPLGDKGPPYAVAEYVFDEYDQGGCSLDSLEFTEEVAAVSQPATDREATVRALVAGRGAGELRTLALADPGLLAVTDYLTDLLSKGAEGVPPSALDLVAAVLKERLLATLDILAAGTPAPATEATLLDQLRWWAGERLQEASRRQEVTPEPEGAEYWAGAVSALHQVLAHLDERRVAASWAGAGPLPIG